jgi:hypothetical protein
MGERSVNKAILLGRLGATASPGSQRELPPSLTGGTIHS